MPGVFLGFNRPHEEMTGKRVGDGREDGLDFTTEAADFYREKDKEKLAADGALHNEVGDLPGQGALLDAQTSFREGRRMIGLLGINRDITDANGWRICAQPLSGERRELAKAPSWRA